MQMGTDRNRNKQVDKLFERLNNSRGLEWKGRPIISSEEWKRLAEYRVY